MSIKKLQYDEQASDSLLDIYKGILSGEIEKFPRGTWAGMQSNKQECIPVIKYAIEEVCGYKSEQEILDNFSSSDLINNKLRGMVIHAFNSSTYQAVILAYPNLKIWQFKAYAPYKYWDDENNITLALKWLIEEKLQWTDQEVVEKFSINTLKENGLTTIINKFEGRPFKILNHAYPDKFSIYEFKNIKNMPEFASKDGTLQYIKKLLDKMQDDQITKLSRTFFTQHNLSTFLVKYRTIYNLVNDIYPGRFKMWQFKVPDGYWDDEQNIIDAVTWMLKKKGVNPEKGDKTSIQIKDYTDNGLSGMLFKKFNGIAHAPIKRYFPNIEIIPTKKTE